MGLTSGPGLDLRICSLNVWNESCPQFWRKTSWRKAYKYYQTLLGGKKTNFKILSTPFPHPQTHPAIQIIIFIVEEKEEKDERGREGGKGRM